jgi:outer membrane protein assembly factor BamB
MNPYALIVGALFVSIATVSAADWPQFRGPTGDGHYEGPPLPTQWGPDKNVVWKTPIQGHGWSSPIVWKGKVYLTTAVEKSGGYSLQALGIDAKTGKIDWTKELFVEDSTKAPKPHAKNSHASPTPVTDGERLYVHFGHMGTAALSLDGKQVFWKTNKLAYKPVHGNGGSPILVDDKLVFSCDGGDVQFIVALNPKTGAVVWKTDRKTTHAKGFSFCTPQVITENGKKMIVSPCSGLVAAYDPAKGTEIWRVPYDGYSLIPRPVFGNGLVYIATGYNTPSLQAIKPDAKADAASRVAWTMKRSVPHTASLLLNNEDLFMVSDAGTASCLNAKTGEVYWAERIAGNYSASPIYHDGKIWFTSEQGNGTVVEASHEFKVVEKNNLDERTFASFAAVDGALFVRTDKQLYRFQGRVD